MPPQTQGQATLIGSSAILLWATLATLTTLAGSLPPFQLMAMAFTLAFIIGLVLWLKQGHPIGQHLRLPLSVWLLGIYGLFGYHFLYFMALRRAPAVEASLIAYLWPLLIVLLSALLPGEKLRWFHIIGAVIAFIGAALLVTGGESLTFEPAYTLGYGLALLCAFTWSSYSVLSRRFGTIPTDAVGAFCGVTAILAAFCHLIFETTVWPVGWEWLAVLGLGLGPVGTAFYTWDYGVKQGNIRVLGAFAYAAPLLSTLLLITLGLAQPTGALMLACLFIVGGALLASADSLRR
ncbi:MAG: DMT family transporter [Chloroflexi bacterium]|nr:DMT family transporter [Chloroflexota bacterium]MBP8055846.1 DMT family transporter [Chloroflexota bacterium]